jgi:hypothetical protein
MWASDFLLASPAPSAETFHISGQVTGSVATLTLSGVRSALTTTDAQGRYSFSGITDGLYVVAPSRTGYTFKPSTALISVKGRSSDNVNFTAAAKPYTVPLPLILQLPPSVVLSWTPSVSPNISGYYVYRSEVPGDLYEKLNTSPVDATVYVDSTVVIGKIYFYVATAVDNDGNESMYSGEATIVVPPR